MLKKALILVPHQDDEIGTAGVVIKNFTDAQAEVYVCYATNGDFELSAEIRIEEAAAALQLLGVPEDHMIILGYPDTSNENMFRHIYYFGSGTQMEAQSGYNRTYGAGGHQDYAFLKEGEHHAYNRANYFRDVKGVIADILPDLVVCTDLDHHVDHRMLSLVFDRAMGEILKEKTDYHPVVWKAFAYGTNFSAPRDYREYNLESTKFPNTRLADNEGRLDNPFYDWNKRIRVPGKREWYEGDVSQSVFYKALACHKSQNAISFAEYTINSDQVFWERRSDNLALYGSVHASSGEEQYLNDFMLFDAEEIHDVEILRMSGLWKPADGDREKKVSIDLDGEHMLESISIWGIGTSVKIRLECGGVEVEKQCSHMFGEVCIQLPKVQETDKLQLWFSYDEEREFGIGEIEVFEKKRPGTEYIKLLIDGNMLDKYYTGLHRPRISLYQYCRHNLRAEEEITFLVNGKEVSRFSIPWGIFLKNRHIKLQVQVKGKPALKDEAEIIRLKFPEWLRIKK